MIRYTSKFVLNINQIRIWEDIFSSDKSSLYLDFACIREFMMVLRRNAEICRRPHTSLLPRPSSEPSELGNLTNQSGKRCFVVLEPGSISSWNY